MCSLFGCCKAESTTPIARRTSSTLLAPVMVAAGALLVRLDVCVRLCFATSSCSGRSSPSAIFLRKAEVAGPVESTMLENIVSRDSSFEGVSNSATFPASRTSITSESIIVLSLRSMVEYCQKEDFRYCLARIRRRR
eukprot:SAG25_NODE_554_length_6983_cov_2.661970_5_plen_137_part_00